MEALQWSWPWLLLLFLVPLLLIKAMRAMGSKHNSFPRPAALPLIGNLHHVGDLPHRSLRSHAAVHGPLMLLHLGAVRALVVSSAAALKEVLKSHDAEFSGRPALYAAKRLSYGLLDITFAPYGDYWRAARRVCTVELLGPPRVQTYRAVREAEAAALVRTIAAAKGDSVNLSELFLVLTNKIMRRIAFGDGDVDGGDGRRFLCILEEAQDMLGGFWIADYVPWLGWVDALTGMRRRLEKNFTELDEYYERVIDAHLNKKPSPSEEERSEDLVDVLLRLRNDSDDSSFSSRNHIKGVLTDMFIGGSNTSAAALTWTMAQLMRHPDVLAKTQRVIRQAVGEKSFVEESDLRQLDYLRLVIMESLRMHPPAPMLVPRETLAACAVQGRTVPAGTRVFVNASAIGMDASVWPEPHTFRPERFEGIGGDVVDLAAVGADAGLVPFGFGRRSCPGISFAGAMMEVVLANVLHCFDWEMPAGEEHCLEEKVGLTVHKKKPLRLLAVPRTA